MITMKLVNGISWELCSTYQHNGKRSQMSATHDYDTILCCLVKLQLPQFYEIGDYGE